MPPSSHPPVLPAATLYAVQHFLNQISVVRLGPDGRSGTVVRVSLR